MDRDAGQTGAATARAVVAIAADLMFAARMRSTADAVGAPLQLARNSLELLRLARELEPRLVIVDLDTRTIDPVETIRQLKADPVTARAPVLAYVSHVREDLIAGAREAGAEQVMARGAFARNLPTILAGNG